MLRKDKRDLAMFHIIDVSHDGPTLDAQEYTKAEWKELQSYMELDLPSPLLPELHPDSLEELKVQALEMISAPVKAFPELGTSLLTLCGIYKERLFPKSHSERAIDGYWSAILDTSFHQTGRYLARGEKASQAIKDLVNNKKLQNDRVYSGPLFDGLILSHNIEQGSDYVEYGYLEVASSAKKQYNPKYINDQQKILKGLCASIINDGGDLRVSILCFGFDLIISYMKRHPCGLFVHYSRPAVRIPKEYSGKALGSVVKELVILQLILGLVEKSLKRGSAKSD